MLDACGNVKGNIAVPKNLTLRYIPKCIKNRDWNRYLYTNIHSSIIHNSQGWKLPKHPWADKWIRKTSNVYTWRLIQL